MGDFLHLIGGAVVGAVCTVFVQRALGRRNGNGNGSNGIRRLAAARELADITTSIEDLLLRVSEIEKSLKRDHRQNG